MESENKKARIEEETALVDIEIKWNNNIYRLSFDPDDDISSLRRKIEIATEVMANRQKIINLKTKKK